MEPAQRAIAMTGLFHLAGDGLPATWARESLEIATKIAYRNGMMPGNPEGNSKDCGEVDAVVLPTSYLRTAGQIGDRRIVIVSRGRRFARGWRSGVPLT